MFYVKTVFALCALSCAAVGTIYFFNNYPFELILTHLLLCLSLFSICAAFAIITGGRKNRPFIQSAMFSLVVATLLIIYLANAISNYFWKANVNLNLVERMVSHYYALYPIETVIIVTVIPAVVFLVIALPFIRLFRVGNISVKRPVTIAFYCLSLSVFLLVNIYTYNIERKQRDVEVFFLGEMLIDLSSEYTDPHQDYLTDAGGIEDVVVHSGEYVVQRTETINPGKKNIIMLVVDCLRADLLPNYGYHRNTMPFFSDFIASNSSGLVENTFSICDESKCGIRAILTSRGLEFQNSLEASQSSLHKRLKDEGYQINFLLTSDHSFGGLKRIYSPYDYYIDGVNFSAYPLNDDRGVISALENWPDYNGSPNYFHFHLYSAHEAGYRYGKYLGKGVHGVEPGFLKGEPIAARFSTEEASDLQSRKDVMDNRLYQTDLLISRIHSLLSEKGYMDNALVIVTGDHGQGLGEHGYVGHIKGLNNESLRVPLIIADTSGDDIPLAEVTYATQLDIAPTVLNLLDIPVSESWEGLALQTAKSEVTVTTHRIPDRSSSYAKTRYDPRDKSLFKYIYLSKLHGMNEERYMYDLINDPAEMTNLLAHPEKQKQYIDLASKWGLDSL